MFLNMKILQLIFRATFFENILAKVSVSHSYVYEGQSNWFIFLVWRMRFCEHFAVILMIRL